MDGFKNSTKTQYMKGGSVNGAAKIAKVMGEFKSGKLHSGSKHGPEVKNPKQAVAIAMSEARKGKAPMKKALGGMVDEGVSTRPTDKYGRRITLAEMDISPAKEAPKKAMAKGIGAMSAALAASKKVTDAMKKAVPAYSDRPMIRRKAGGLAAMPKGKCK